MDKNNSLTIDEIFNLAVKSHQENKTDIAQQLYNQVLKIDPNHSAALSNLGTIFKNLGNHQRAMNFYEKAIEINPNNVDAINNLGGIFKNLRDPQNAINCFKKIIKIDPNYKHSYFNLGVIYLDLEEYEKAKNCYEKTIEIDLNYADAHNNLGLVFKKLGENEKAKNCYEKAIAINPNNIDTHNNLGKIFYTLGEIQKSLNCYEMVLKIDPSDITAINSLSYLLSSYKFNHKSKADKASFKKLILLIFKSDNIDPADISTHARLLLLSDNESNDLWKVVNTDTILKKKFIQNLLKEELFHLMLQKSLFVGIFWEKLLTKLRCEILLNLENSNNDVLNEHLVFIISLAEQCWLNEFIYAQSEKEINFINKLKNKIDANKEVNEIEISILACYIPLNNSKIIIQKLLDYKSSNVLFNNLITVLIKEPLKEKELVKSIKSLGQIVDPVSKKVQEQYEEHPYPRWRITRKTFTQYSFEIINQDIKPNSINQDNKLNNPNVLIAGCGTGNHSISATRYKNSNILAVDLSLSSLAYAKRKTEEMGYKNIEYMHADILHLNKLNKKFDVIESSGVLHHMRDPMAGLKVLVDILEPHGFLKLGLYSNTARQHIVKARESIKIKNLKNTNESIKKFRQDIIDKKVSSLTQKVTLTEDFYSTSAVRDLLFHIQEHRFTIPQISKILENFNLEFLGFIQNPSIKQKYSKYFPEDKKYTSLDNLHKFEEKNPDTFWGMYQFWVRKLH